MNPGSSYRPGREIARGGMGAVLDARDQKIGRSVAMKVMLRRNASEEEQQRFLQEARVLGQLAHPNIVPVHDVGTDEQGRLFYTMKLVQGVTLHDVIGKLKAGDKDNLAKYPLNALLTVFQKVCDAVAFAHSRGIIHRDLKPQNIMVGEFGEVLVMDWGLAKILPGSAAADEAAKALPLRGQLGQTGPTGTLPLNAPAGEELATLVAGAEALDQATVAPGTGSAAAPKLAFGSQQPEPIVPSGVYATMEGAVMGTPHFMSPEQAEGKIAELDARSDIFSLGGILYALLTLRPPVEGESLEEILSKVRSGTIAPPTAFNAPSSTTSAKAPATGTVTEPRKIRPLPHCPDGKVPAALSAVTMKALTRDKARRYQSVAEFTQDITAYQGGFATSAENADALTLALLFFRRNKVLATAAALVLLVILIALPVVITSERKAKANAARAQANANEARAHEDQAKANAKAADDNATKAKASEAEALESGAVARRALAKSALNLAEAAMREGDGPAMQAALNDVPDDLRDSTWSYLLAHSDQSIAHIRTGAETIGGVAADPTRPGVFAVVDLKGKVTILNARTGERQLEFRLGLRNLNQDARYCLAFSPDGQRIAAGRHASGLGGLVIHRAVDGAKETEWQAPPVRRLEFGRNDALLVQGNDGLQVWNPVTGQLWWEEKRLGNIGVRGTFTPGGNEVVKFTNKDRLQLVKANDGSVVRQLGGRGSAYSWFMAVRPDGKAVVTWNDTRVTECVSLEDGRLLFNLAGKKFRHHMGFDRDGTTLFTAALSGNGVQSIEAWDAKTGAFLRAILGGQGQISELAVHQVSGELLVAGVASRTWETANPTAFRRVGSSPGGNVAFWGPEDWVFCVGGAPRQWGLHRLQPNILERLWSDGQQLGALAEISADGRFAFVTRPGYGGEVALLRKTGTQVERAGAFNPNIRPYRIRPSPTGSRVVLLERAADFSLGVFDTAGKEALKLELTDARRVSDLRWLSEERLVGLVTYRAVRGNPGSHERIVLWDGATGQALQTTNHPTAVDTLAIAPDGRRFAEAGADKLVRIRDATTLAVLQQFRAHNAPITVLAWHPTEPILATGSEDLSIKVWNFATGRLLTEFRDLLDPPDHVVFSPSGRLLAARTFPDLIGRIWPWQGESQGPPGAPSPGTAPKSSSGAGWADLLASLTPATVTRTDTGWRMDSGALFSSGNPKATLALPGDFSNASYQLRVTLRRLAPKDFFSIALPVGDRKVGLVLDGVPHLGFVTGLNQVSGKSGAASPGAVKGLQVRDSEQHELEVTVRLDGAKATITATLDSQPCYSWTGPVASLSQHPDSVPTPPGALAIKAIQSDWVVYEVKVKRLDAK